MTPRRDVHAQKPGFAAFNARVPLAEIDLAGADGLDLATGQGDARLDPIVDAVVVEGPSVVGDRPLVFGHSSKVSRNAMGGRECKGRRSKDRRPSRVIAKVA